LSDLQLHGLLKHPLIKEQVILINNMSHYIYIFKYIFMQEELGERPLDIVIDCIHLLFIPIYYLSLVIQK
jgi:hypothetical protein